TRKTAGGRRRGVRVFGSASGSNRFVRTLELHGRTADERDWNSSGAGRAAQRDYFSNSQRSEWIDDRRIGDRAGRGAGRYDGIPISAVWNPRSRSIRHRNGDGNFPRDRPNGCVATRVSRGQVRSDVGFAERVRVFDGPGLVIRPFNDINTAEVESRSCWRQRGTAAAGSC